MSLAAPQANLRTVSSAGPAELRSLLAMALAGLGAADGVIWKLEGDGEPVPLHQTGLGQQSIAGRHAAWPGHSDLLKGVLAAGSARVVQARFEPEQPSAPPRELRIVLAPLAGPAAGRVGFLLEVFLPAGVSGAGTANLSDDQTLRLVEGLIRTQRGESPIPAVPSAGHGALERLLEFSLRTHQSLDLRETAYAIVAEAQRLLEADRVALLTTRRGRAELLALSGVDRPDPRATAVQELQRFAGSVAGVGTPLRLVGGELTGPGDVRDDLAGYAQRSSLTQFEAVPLQRGGETLGVLIAEDFSQRPTKGWPLLPGLSAIAASALDHALQQADLPLAGLSQRLRRRGLTRRGLSRFIRMLMLAALGAGAVALATVPARLEVTGRGALVPEVRRDVFAPLAGVVDAVEVRHGEDVAAGKTLLTLRSQPLDYEITRVQGELQTTEQQIADVTSLRTDPSRPQDRPSSDAELAAREEELKSVRENLRKQRALLEEQRGEQTVRAPIGGRVLTWDVSQLLEERPVERGQRLLTVGEVAGRWIVELRVPDRDLGHLRAAFEANRKGEGLAATFSVTTDLDHQIPARVLSIADVVEDDPVEGPSVLVRLGFARETLPELVPGATAVGRVDCGQRVVGYVWFRRLIDAVRTWWQY